MAAQDHVRQFLAMDDADDVLDVRAEIDRAAHQMGAFAKSGQSRRIDLVPSLAQQPRHPPIAPAAMPGAVNQNEGGHESSNQRKLLDHLVGAGEQLVWYSPTVLTSLRALRRDRPPPSDTRLQRFGSRSNQVRAVAVRRQQLGTPASTVRPSPSIRWSAACPAAARAPRAAMPQRCRA